MSITLYKRGKIWHYRGSVAGRRLRGTTRTSDKAIAIQIIAEKEARAWKCHINGPESVLTFAQAAILYRQAGKSPRFLEIIEDYWKDTPVRAINAGAVRQASIVLYPGVGGATRNRQVIVPAQAVINHAAELELCQRLSVRRFPVERKEREPVTWEWCESFMASANPHLGALCCFMLLTGARVTEALNVMWNDVDLTRSRALIRQTKVCAERSAHLPPALVAAMSNIEGERLGKVFKYSSRNTAKAQWNKAVKRAGLRHLSFHCCRHGFATGLLRAGVDVITIAKLGGWKDARHVLTTYGHALDDPTLTDRIVDTKETQIKCNALITKT